MVNWKEKFKKLEAEGVSIVDDLFQVELLRSYLLKKLFKSFYITSLTFTDKGKCLVSNLMVTPNRQYNELPILHDATVLTTEGFARKRTFFCKALLNVEVEGERAIAHLNHEIYCVGEGIDTRFISFDNKNRLVDLITGKKVDTDIVFDADGSVKDGVIVYNNSDIGAQTCSNGQLKKHNITLVADNLPGFDAYKSWDTVTYGAATILCKGEKGSPKDIAQANTRLSAYKAPSIGIGRVNTIAYYMGLLTFKDTGDEYRDGFAFLSAEYLAKIFTAYSNGNYFFAPWAADGLMVQCRPWLNKVMAETVRQAYIEEYIECHYFNQQAIILERGKITAEQQEAFEYAVQHKGKRRPQKDIDAGKLDFGDHLVIICDNAEEAGDIQFFTDLNGLKAPYDLKTESDLEILDMSHGAHDVFHGSNTSSQLIQSLMINDPQRTMDLMMRHADNLLKSKKEALLAEAGRAPSWAEFVGSSPDFRPDYQQLTGRIVPQFAWQRYAPLYHSLVDNSLKGYVTGIRRLNLPTAGAYAKVVPDTAADFGVKILNICENTEVEIVCPIGTMNGFKRAIGVKYPKMHFVEYLKGKIISWKEYADRVRANLELTEAQKEVIIEHVRHLSPGAIMIPAVEHLKNMLAGMDFDGDAVQLFFDKDIVDILWQGETKAVIIDENDTVEEKTTAEKLGFSYQMVNTGKEEDKMKVHVRIYNVKEGTPGRFMGTGLPKGCRLKYDDKGKAVVSLDDYVPVGQAMHNLTYKDETDLVEQIFAAEQHEGKTGINYPSLSVSDVIDVVIEPEPKKYESLGTFFIDDMGSKKVSWK